MVAVQTSSLFLCLRNWSYVEQELVITHTQLVKSHIRKHIHAVRSGPWLSALTQAAVGPVNLY